MQDKLFPKGQEILVVYSIKGRYHLMKLYVSRRKYQDASRSSNQRQVSKSDGEGLIKECGSNCKFYEASAKDKINHEIVFYDLVRSYLKIHLSNSNEGVGRNGAGNSGDYD